MATAAPAGSAKREVDRLFYGSMAIVAIAVTLVGFGPSFYLNRYYQQRTFTPLVLAHGIAFTCWVLLLAVQSSLIAIGRTSIHRKVGVAGGALAAAMVALGSATAIAVGRRGLGTANETAVMAFLPIPLFSVWVFGVLVAGALFWRRRPETHKRLMLVATISILSAAIARFHLAVVFTYGATAFYILTDVLLLVCVLYDVATRKRLHSAYLWGGLILLTSQHASIWIAHTDPWIRTARWLCGA